ncbi:MAG: inositol monophosphatase family protein [Planctomycetaceae bacterium]
MQELEVARQAARAAGEVLLRAMQAGPIVVREKQASDLVSDADLESERVIAAIIRETFPHHSILGEETLKDDVSAEHLWVIDPLDGTTNFAHGIPHFAVSIAYYLRGEPKVGVVWNPARNDHFEAVAGRGAHHNGRVAKVSAAKSLSEVLVGVGFYYDRGAMMEATLSAVGDLFRQQIRGIRRMGTASLDLCQVGLGWYGGFFEYELSPWDFAAGRLFLTEAGGAISTCKGDPLPMQKTSVLASNQELHESLLSIVGPHFRNLSLQHVPTV